MVNEQLEFFEKGKPSKEDLKRLEAKKEKERADWQKRKQKERAKKKQQFREDFLNYFNKTYGEDTGNI